MTSESEATPPGRSDRIRGVYETSWGGSWFAQVRHRGKLHYLGTYPSPEDAAEAYRLAKESLG